MVFWLLFCLVAGFFLFWDREKKKDDRRCDGAATDTFVWGFMGEFSIFFVLIFSEKS